jgi:hypothetical protein
VAEAVLLHTILVKTQSQLVVLVAAVTEAQEKVATLVKVKMVLQILAVEAAAVAQLTILEVLVVLE